ncbi:MAG: hypothetical protein IJN90_02010 [Bacilli bacterium]|nr:hypothetical protein [Bacilli bacterium]
MDEYTRLKNKLEAYLNMPDVELTENEISIYALRELIKDKLEELRKIQFDSDLPEEINKSYTIIERVGRVFKKKISMCQRQCTQVMSYCNGNKSEITFCFKVKDSCVGSEYLTICKDMDSDQIYFDRHHADKEFVERHFDRISEHFSILEEFSKLYQGGVGGSGKGVGEIISDGFFNIEIESDTYGRTNIKTTLTKTEDKEGLFTREWFQRQTLKELYQEEEDDILKKISVSINSLNYTYQTIVKSAISKQNVPQLVKRK